KNRRRRRSSPNDTLSIISVTLKSLGFECRNGSRGQEKLQQCLCRVGFSRVRADASGELDVALNLGWEVTHKFGLRTEYRSDRGDHHLHFAPFQRFCPHAGIGFELRPNVLCNANTIENLQKLDAGLRFRLIANRSCVTQCALECLNRTDVWP